MWLRIAGALIELKATDGSAADRAAAACVSRMSGLHIEAPRRVDTVTMMHRKGRKRFGESALVPQLQIGPSETLGAAPYKGERATRSERRAADEHRIDDERRRGRDRRTSTVRSLVTGSLNPRRRGPRRAYDRSIAATDWYEPQWLAVAVLILLLSVADALLTLALLQYRGILEANPVMAAFVNGNPTYFAAVKIGFTAAGVVLLTSLARVRAFGRIPVSILLCVVLAGYVTLVAYETWLLRSIGGFS